MKVYLNGKFIEASRAQISAFDAGVQHGVGLFETMQAFRGQVFRLTAHLDRLVESARVLGLTDRLRPTPLRDAILATLAENNSAEARVRLTITGGAIGPVSAVSARGEAKHQPGVMIVAGPVTEYPPGFFENGVSVVIADAKANPFDPLASHKALNYWARLTSLARAAAAKAGEALWFTVTNHLCGGAVSNALLVKDGQLYTPIVRGEEPAGALPSPTLPGITRAAVIEIAEELDLPVHRKMLSINDVLEADELMLTNSSWQILPVVRVEKESIGEGAVGPITKQLREKLLGRIAEECP